MHYSDCGKHPWGSNRRDFLFVGALGAFGLTLPKALALEKRSARAKSVIHIFLPGGMASQESFDPKVDAPIEYRGPLSHIKTVLPGVAFSENLAHTAKIADKIVVIRSFTHGEAAHERGTHNLFTGYKPSPSLQYPSMGSVVSHQLGGQKNLPAYVTIPNFPNEFAGAGFLSSAFGPFSIGSDPASPNFAVRDLTVPDSVTPERAANRKKLRELVDEHFSQLEQNDKLQGMDEFYSQAYSLISSERARAAFDVKAESDTIKDMYGRNTAGMRMLLARRLIEGGVRFVTLTYGGWDHHDQIRDNMNRQLPNFDKAFAALITDLDAKGLLDETLVLVTTEFGRTPKINATAGRDHWPGVFSIVMAGAGLQNGMVYGASDANSNGVGENPVHLEDYAATVYHLLGIDHDKDLLASGGRPIKIVYHGTPIKGILA
jgi:hypothetical protein